MPGYAREGRSGNPAIQAGVPYVRILSHALAACALLCGCDPLEKPIDLFHGLEGGEIAAERPPPPGAGEPYPHVGTVPDRPGVPTPAFRNAMQTELATERDQKELLAADLPMEKVPPPPQAAPASPAAGAAAAPGAAQPPANTQADAADSSATIAAADSKTPAAPAGPPPPPPLPADAKLQIVGEPLQFGTLPLVPDAPPAPATFEGVPPEPMPSPRLLPQPVPLPKGKPVFFANGSDVITPSQKQSIGEIAGSRGKKSIEIIGLGEAEFDTPLGQEAAIDLGLRRARAVADTFAAMHVPQTAMRLSARPYGRGALIVLLP
jgi:outer membrane protein OmpA-like peptidoglycan-associated protein